MSTPSVDVRISLSGQEQLDATEAPAAQSAQQRLLSAGSISLAKKLNAATLPRVDKPPVSLKITLGGGTTTINLTAVAALALPGSATRTVDLTGAKISAFAIRAAPTNNAGGVTVAPGASNAYALFGASKPIICEPGSVLGKSFDGVASALPAVASGAKNIDLSGTSGDVLFIDLYAGT